MADLNYLFIRWPEGRTKDQWRDQAERGWEALKICTELAELEMKITDLKEIAREELCVGKGLRPCKKVKLITKY